MIVENIIPRNMIINLGCASVDNHIPWDDIFDYHLCRECIIYILLAGTIPWPGFPLPCYKHTGAYRHARKRCTYGSFMEGAVMQQW